MISLFACQAAYRRTLLSPTRHQHHRNRKRHDRNLLNLWCPRRRGLDRLPCPFHRKECMVYREQVMNTGVTVAAEQPWQASVVNTQEVRRGLGGSGVKCGSVSLGRDGQLIASAPSLTQVLFPCFLWLSHGRTSVGGRNSCLFVSGRFLVST